MNRYLVFVVLALFIFGCIDFGGEKPKLNTTQNNTTVIVNVEPQKNVTIVINQTNQTETEQNQSSQVWSGPNYGYDPTANLGVYFIDACDYETGKSAAAILVKKGDFDMLIDGGSANSAPRVIEFLKSKGVDDIDVLVSSAEDPNRYAGLKKISDEFAVEEFWWNGQATTRDYMDTINYVSGKALNTTTVKALYSRELNGIKVEVLNPTKLQSDIYNDAIVLKLTDRSKSILLLSNIVGGGQGYIANKYPEMLKNIDVMEAPYYGLGSGTTIIGTFFQTCKPKTVVIEGCSDETGGPQSSTRLPFKTLMNQYGIDYLETYKNGTVKVSVVSLTNETADLGISTD